MKKSTRIFMEKQLAINKARMEREAKGDYGQPIHIVVDLKDAQAIPMSAIKKIRRT